MEWNERFSSAREHLAIYQFYIKLKIKYMISRMLISVSSRAPESINLVRKKYELLTQYICCLDITSHILSLSLDMHTFDYIEELKENNCNL